MVSYPAGRSEVDFSNIDYVTPLIIGGVAIRLILIKISYSTVISHRETKTCRLHSFLIQGISAMPFPNNLPREYSGHLI